MRLDRPHRVLFETDHSANGHVHRLRVLEVAFDDATEIAVELSEPDKCGCASWLPLSEVAHLVLNLTEQERLEIPNRNRDQAGHWHG